ncbi:TonB-dependent receptor [Alloalcanivorax xenomutans]|uniref:TonB-dependent receptor n=1 Tax=Alloalcanivorax xenomutans TaxID=1094342 RepID=UPI003BAD97BF
MIKLTTLLGLACSIPSVYATTMLPPIQVQEDAPTDILPLSASSFGIDDLHNGPAAHAGDLPLRATSLQLTEPENRYTGIFIRGLGTTGFNDGMSGSVGISMDGVHLGRQSLFPAQLYDLESVSVIRTPLLSGPGPATSAGAIQLRSRAPQWYRGTAFSTTIGSDRLQHHQIIANEELIQGRLAGRLAAYQHRRDGAETNKTRHENVNNQDHRGVRGQLLWRINNQTQARFILEHSLRDERCCAYSALHYSQTSKARAAALGHPLPTPAPFSRTVWQDSGQHRRIEQNAATVQWHQALSPRLTLASISGWRNWKYANYYDLDSIDLAIAPTGGADMDHHQWSQELRLSGALSAPFRYQLGAYYLHQSHQRNRDLSYGKNAAAWFSGGQPLPPEVLDGATVRAPGKESATTLGLLGELSWAISPAFTVAGIARYSHDRKRGSLSQRIEGLRTLPPVPELEALRRALLGVPVQGRHDIKDDSVDGGLQLRFMPNDEVMYFVTASSGYKSGGINGENTRGAVRPTFNAEHSLSLESGLHYQPAPRHHLRVVLYHNTIRDYQALTYNPDSSPLIPQMNNIINVNKVRSRGAELEAGTMLPGNLLWTFGVAYNDARYVDFRNAPCPPESGVLFCDLSGKQMANAPRHTAFSGLQRSWPLDRGGEFYAGLSWQYRSGYYGTTERGQGSSLDSRQLLHGAIGIRAPRWQLELWGRNLTDQDYLTSVFAVNGSGDYGALVGEPRTLGVSITIRVP